MMILLICGQFDLRVLMGVCLIKFLVNTIQKSCTNTKEKIYDNSRWYVCYFLLSVRKVILTSFWLSKI